MRSSRRGTSCGLPGWPTMPDAHVPKSDHRIEVVSSFLARGWYATCSCGWESTFAEDTADQAADEGGSHVAALSTEANHG